jgi:hypothetical protein
VFDSLAAKNIEQPRNCFELLLIILLYRGQQLFLLNYSREEPNTPFHIISKRDEKYAIKI